MKIEEMTFNEVKDYLKKNSTLIIPVGTLEQHGYHLPINFDTLAVEYFAEILSNKTGCLIASTVNYGVNSHFDKVMTGTTSIDEETLRKTVLSIIDWWRFQGFKKFILLTFHDGTFHIRALSKLREDVHLIRLCEIITYENVLEKQDTMKHACEAETSIALHICPKKVRLAEARDMDIPMEELGDYLFERKKGLPDGYVGSVGYPSFATKKKGKILAERMVKNMLKEFNGF